MKMATSIQYPICARVRDGFTTLNLSSDQVTAAGNAVSAFLTNLSKLTPTTSGVTYSADALTGLSIGDAYNLAAAVNTYNRLGTVKGGWQKLQQGTIRPVTSGPTASVATPNFAPPPPSAACVSALSNVEFFANAAVSTLGSMNDLITQINAAIPQAELAVAQASGPQATQAEWQQLQTQALQLQGWLSQLQGKNLPAFANLAAKWASAAFSAADSICSNYQQIVAANQQAVQAAAAATSISQDPNLEWDSFVVSAFLQIPEPPSAPAPTSTVSFNPTVSVQTWGSLLPTFLSPQINLSLDFNIPIAVTLSIDETDTQSLITFLKSNDGGSVASAVYQALVNIVSSSISAALGDGFSVGTFAGAVFQVFLQLQEQEIVSVLQEADNHAKGVSFHFGIIPSVVATFGAINSEGGGIVLTAAAAAIVEGNLAQELGTPGGVGSPWLDVFWITGN
jgi:hypothetical protein